MKELTLLTPLILAAGIVLGLLNHQRNPRVAWLIFGYLTAELSLELVSRYFGTTGSRNNLIFLSLAGALDVLFYTLLYQLFYFEKRRYWLMVLPVAVLILPFLAFSKSVEASGFNSYDKVIADALVVIYAVISSFDLIMGKGPVRREVMRVNAAVLLFYALDMLVSMTQNFLINAGIKYVIYFFILRVLFLQMLYLILVITLWQTGKNRKR